MTDLELTPAQKLVYTGAGGKLQELPPACSRVVRIFISSTFTGESELHRSVFVDLCIYILIYVSYRNVSAIVIL